jgi:hypothetical protein
MEGFSSLEGRMLWLNNSSIVEHDGLFSRWITLAKKRKLEAIASYPPALKSMQHDHHIYVRWNPNPVKQI